MEQRLFNVDIKIARFSNVKYPVTTWDSMTLTQYSDSILEVRFSGSLSSNNDSSAPNQGLYENSKHDLFLDINGSTEYTVENCANTSATDRSYASSAGRRQGATVAMFHRHLPGTTNLQTMTIQVSRANNNGGGNMQGQDGFIVAKEVAGGITTGTWQQLCKLVFGYEVWH